MLLGVTTEPHGFAGLQYRGRTILHYLHRHIQIPYRGTAEHITQVIHGIGLPIGVGFARVIHQANIIAQVIDDIFIGELLGSNFSQTLELVVFIVVLPYEFFRRCPQVDIKNPVDSFEQSRLYFPDSFRLVLRGFPHREGALPQVAFQDPIHVFRVRGGFGFWHGPLGHYPVFIHQRHKHIPLAAVPNRVRQQMSHCTVIEVPIGQLNLRF